SALDALLELKAASFGHESEQIGQVAMAIQVRPPASSSMRAQPSCNDAMCVAPLQSTQGELSLAPSLHCGTNPASSDATELLSYAARKAGPNEGDLRPQVGRGDRELAGPLAGGRKDSVRHGGSYRRYRVLAKAAGACITRQNMGRD